MASRIQIGDTVISKQRAQKIIDRAKKNGLKQKRLGVYEIEKDGVHFKAMHILEAGEQELMRLQCKAEGHAFMLSGYCAKCHEKE